MAQLMRDHGKCVFAGSVLRQACRELSEIAVLVAPVLGYPRVMFRAPLPFLPRTLLGLSAMLATLALSCGAATDDGMLSNNDGENSTPEADNNDDTDISNGTGNSGPDDSASGGEPPIYEGPIMPAACGGNILAGPLGPNENWIGGNPVATEDDPCGIQGPIYAFSDAATAAVPSCVVPADPFRTIACIDGKCCLSGSTQQDITQAAWGCGIGIGLKHTAVRERLPYEYPSVVGFRYTIEGSLTEGQRIRVGYRQVGAAENSCPPFQSGYAWGASPINAFALEVGPYSDQVRFLDVLCPMDGAEACQCLPAGPAPLDIQFQVTGGNVNGPFEFCLTELAPLFESDAQ